MIDLSNFVGALLGNRSLFELDIAGAPELTRVVRFSGHESISRLFEFHVELAGPEVELASVLGKPARLTIDGIDVPRRVHGIVSHVEYTGHSRRYTLYELTLVPPLWRLLHRHDCRIFQHKTTQQVLGDVFKAAGLDPKAIRFDLQASYEPRNYCVQYRESDFSFVSRLMEEDGIFYYFEHDDEKATLVIADHAGTHGPIPGKPAVAFNEGSEVRAQEHVTHMRVSESVRPGKLSLRDYNFHTPDEKMEVSADAPADVDLEVYDYPGEYQKPSEGAPHHGQSMAKIRLEALQAPRRQGSGGSDCMRLTPGYTFALSGHPRGELNGEHLITRVVHHGSQPQVLDEDGQGAFHYGNDFSTISKDTPFRPPRVTPRPVVRGVQSATVVGPGTEEVHTDAQGRVMVQFHWDRQGKMDEKSSCWVRVSQLWAGKSWGAMFIPRVGHEVLVDFIEGDPDRPIITGRVYHGKNEVPYPLPDEKTKSTIKSNSSLGGEGYNELRYEDRKGAEQIYLHAERNLDVRVNNDAFSTVWQNAHVTVGHDEEGKAGDSFVQLFHDHHLKIHRHTKAHLGGDVELLVGGIDAPGRVDLHIRSDKLELVDGERHEHVRKSTLEKVDGSVSRIVEGNEQVKIGGRLAVETRDEVHFRSPKIVLKASEGLTIEGPGGFVTINDSGIYIKGNMVYINSGGSAIVGQDARPGKARGAKDAVPVEAEPSERGSK